MIRIFISHSSEQKAFVEKLVSKLSKTKCVVDAYDFEVARKSKDEIFRNIRQAAMFVLLISRSALRSEWVQMEIEKAKDRSDKNKIKIYPYIIDDNINWDDEEIPSWITKEEAINLKRFQNPLLLSREISNKHDELVYEKYPRLKYREEIFVGRNSVIEEIESRIYSPKSHNIRALIISGRPGVGRHKVLNFFLRTRFSRYERQAIVVELERNMYIENFILQLNEYVLKYNFKDFQWSEWSDDRKVEVAVELLNKAYEMRLHVVINDDAGICFVKGELVDWLSEIIENPSLDNLLGLFVISTRKPSRINADEMHYASINVFPLGQKDRERLMYAYAQNQEIQLNQKDVDFFVERLQGSPLQIFLAVDSINKDGLFLAKHNIQTIIDFGDKSLKNIIDFCNSNCCDDIKYMDIVVLLTNLGPVTGEFLLNIVGTDNQEKLIEILGALHNLSIISYFGPSNQYIKLDSGIADCIDRSEYRIRKEFQDGIERISTEYLSNGISPYDTDDLSEYLFRTQVDMQCGKISDYKQIVPSVAIKAIIELYRKAEYKSVTKLCEGFLQEKSRINISVYKEIQYWNCAALARIQDYEKFNLAINDVVGLTRQFLIGFYKRLEGDWSYAEKCFKRILKENPNHAKASRELVTVYLQERKYNDALEMARENYDNNKTNPYHIEAYFRCLVRKIGLSQSEKLILQDLIVAMEKSYDFHKEILSQVMRSEYEYYIDREVQKPLKTLRRLATKQNAINYAKKALSEIETAQQLPLTVRE